MAFFFPINVLKPRTWVSDCSISSILPNLQLIFLEVFSKITTSEKSAPFNEAFSMTAGLRYTKEDRDYLPALTFFDNCFSSQVLS